ncbi:MAG: hypothetical protein M3O36_06240 [Myxococcota bacterium]|nr:hypothetical protein [Myxococcota bacterium]
MSPVASPPPVENEQHRPLRPATPQQERESDERPQGDPQGPPGKKEEGE